METNKEPCPHCGAAYRIVGYFGPDLIPIRQWACQSNPNKQSEYCALIVRHRVLIDAAREVVTRRECRCATLEMPGLCSVCKLRKAVQDGN